MAEELRRDRLCPCNICKVSYEVLGIAEGIFTREETTKIRNLPETPDSRKIETDEGFHMRMTLNVMINAAVEYAFREGCSPDQFSHQVMQAWNNRAQRCIDIMRGVEVPTAPREDDNFGS